MNQISVNSIGHFLDGARVAGHSRRFGEVFDPATGAVAARLSLADADDVHAAVASARKAQPAWAAQNPQRRARVMMRFVQLINRDMDRLAEMLSREHGKTLPDSKGEIQRGLEVAEFMIGLPDLIKGEFTEGAGPGIDMYSLRQPVGVGVGITPFNFPAMIPLWMSAPAIACGNAFILKPSERDPSVPLRLAELMLEAGLPPGVFQVLNGDRETVVALIAEPCVDAISFVGSTPVARAVYAAAAASGKRVQSFGGAKNHLVVMPDADIGVAADALMGAAFGSAGERCMAVSVAVPVGERTAEELRAALVERIDRLRVGPFFGGDVDMGPVVTKEACARIKALIARGVEEGADLTIDGRRLSLQGYENGFFLGPSLFDRVTRDMEIYKTEIFGPVLSMVRAKSYEEALALPSDHEYGNGVSIFTRDGGVARDFVSRVPIGMVGVNVPVPVPLAYYGFGGWKASAFGDLNQHGPDSIRFWTRTKTVATRWPSSRSSPDFSMPTAR
jgi:malonate-semialdehyde dehydrogenase (acetylating)/methylmalonate-semialdehyde dehydrogenase